MPGRHQPLRARAQRLKTALRRTAGRTLRRGVAPNTGACTSRPAAAARATRRLGARRGASASSSPVPPVWWGRPSLPAVGPLRLRLLDRRPVRTERDDEAVRADVGDLDAMDAACQDVAAIVHCPPVVTRQGTLDELISTTCVARTRCSRRRHVWAGRVRSTGQVACGYGPDERVTPDMMVRPTSTYACTKAFGEALARYTPIGTACR